MFFLFLCLVAFPFGLIEGRGDYAFTNDAIDVLIPASSKDLLTLDHCIKGILTNGKNIRRVIVVSDKKFTDNAEWFDEKNYPFTKSDIALYLCHGNHQEADHYLQKKNSRVGWYYQQLLKFYAFFVIPDISPNLLILDADTIFLKPTAFTNRNGGALLCTGREFHHEYFCHMDRLTGGKVSKQLPEYSGICHHMLFQKPLVDDIFHLVENHHRTEFWKAFCLAVHEKERSGASEYEIYFNFALAQTDQIETRELKWKNIPTLNLINKFTKKGYDFVSCHSYMRRK